MSIILDPIDDPVQSQTIPGIANPLGGTVIHMSRELDSTTTLVGNKSCVTDNAMETLA